MRDSQPTKQIMYQFIDGQPTEVVRHGEEILPVHHWKVSQIIGQMVLFDADPYSRNIAE